MTGVTPHKVLIVEDDLALAEMLQAYLSAQGYRVFTAGWGQRGLEMAANHHPDLVILDIHLPDTTGFEICQQLRTDRVTQQIPVLFLTELNERDARMHGLGMGSVDYISKPFDIQELRLRVRNILARAAAFTAENPVTGLPGGEEVWAALERAQHAGNAGLVVFLGGLDAFRDLYGFVAADDVLRVISLMLSNAARETTDEGAFCGHLDDQTFIILVPSERLGLLEYRIRERAAQSLEYFYPSDNRGPTAHTQDRLRLELGRVTKLDAPADDLRLLRSQALRSDNPFVRTDS